MYMYHLCHQFSALGIILRHVSVYDNCISSFDAVTHKYSHASDALKPFMRDPT